MSLPELICLEIQERGPIPFSRFMEYCLYHPQLGYYMSDRPKFGKSGDYYTASDTSALYGRLLARQLDEMWRVLEHPKPFLVVELGPGRGLFAHDLLCWSREKFPEFFDALHYAFVEISPTHQTLLAERFAARLQAGRVSIHPTLSTVPRVEGTVVFANEFFDALPLDIVGEEGQLYVALDQGARLAERWLPPSAEVLEFLDRFAVQPQPAQRVEASTRLKQTLEEISRILTRGFAVIVDYGYTRQELLRGAPADTVRAFRSHSVHSSLFDTPGQQDITAGVNFTAIESLASELGMIAAPLVSLGQFLLGIGQAKQFAEVFEGATARAERTKRALQLKHLLMPQGLGEAFRVLILGREISPEQLHALDGLSLLSR